MLSAQPSDSASEKPRSGFEVCTANQLPIHCGILESVILWILLRCPGYDSMSSWSSGATQTRLT